MATQTEENYLKALFALVSEQGEANLSVLSKRLQVSTPTANSMVKKLYQQGLVEYQRYKPIALTEKGKRQAALIIRKHRLTEMFLVEKMGFAWDEVHEIAEQMEHIHSPSFFERMDELMGYPTTDPHGSPIPDKNGKIVQNQYRKLSECAAGETVRLSALTLSSVEFLRFLDSRALKLGMEITILSKEAFDGSMVVRYGAAQQVTLSFTVGERLLVVG